MWPLASRHRTIPQSNGHAEAAVKAMKTNCKGNLSCHEFVTGLLEWRDTPKEHGCSPAQLLYGHSIRTRVPATAAALKQPVDEDAVAEKCQKSILKYRDQYDSRAADLSSLKVGQSVRIQDMVSKLWEKTGKIERVCADQRSYKVLADNGKVYWRNRKFLRPIPDASADINTDLATESLPLPASAGGRGKRKVRFRTPIDDADERDTAGELRRSSRRRRCPDFYGTSTSTTLDRAQGGDGVGATS